MIEARIAAFFVALLLVCAMFVVYHLRWKQTLKRTLAGREQVPAADFGSRYYTDPRKAEIGTFIVMKLQEIAGYELTGVLPSDRINGDLYIDELDSLGTVEAIAAVEAQFGIRIGDEEAARTETVGDFVELVAAKVGESR